MANRKANRIKLSADERAVLDRRVRRRKIARADAQRAEIILRAADGLNNCEIAGVVGVTRQTVRTWRDRFAKHRLNGIDDGRRCGAPRKIGGDRIEEIVTKTLETKPADAEAAARLLRYGANTLDARRRYSLLRKILSRFRNPLVLILLAAAAISALTGDVTSLVIISTIVLLERAARQHPGVSC